MEAKGIKRRIDNEVVQDLISIKSKLESNLGSLRAERDHLKARIHFVREMKDQVRRKKSAELLNLFKLKVSRIDADKRLANQLNHIKSINKTIDDVVNGIHSKISMSDYENTTNEIRLSTEFLLNFYNEDNLQMELMKRTNNVRERRVEYTKVESEYNDLTRKIEEEKREKERVKIREQEKAREEEERLKNLDLDKIRDEEAKKREEFRLQQKRSYAPTSDLQLPFLNNMRLPGIDNKETPQCDAQLSSVASHEQVSARISNVAPQPAKSSGVTFSQLLRWD